MGIGNWGWWIGIEGDCDDAGGFGGRWLGRIVELLIPIVGEPAIFFGNGARCIVVFHKLICF